MSKKKEPKASKEVATKKTVVTAGISRLTPSGKVAKVKAVDTKSQNSATYKASPELKASLTALKAAAKPVEDNVTQQEVLHTSLSALVKDLPPLVITLDNAFTSHASTVQTVANNSAAIVLELGMTTKADRVVPSAETFGPPTGVRVSERVSGTPYFEWDDVLGVMGYFAEYCATPATEAGYKPLIGKGKSRPFEGILKPGVEYSLRVRSIAHDTTMSDWSAIVTFTMK